MKIFYRLSDNSYVKPRLKNATKEHCLENFLTHFRKEEVKIYADNVTDQTFDWLQTVGCELSRTNGGSSAGSFRIVLEDAMQIEGEEIIYFVEDDYLHLSNSRKVILEGLERAHYVSLYDHRDKYMSPNIGGNIFISHDGIENTRVFLTNTSHWKFTNSTTMTFATRLSILKEDYHIWTQFVQGTHPNDMGAFLELGKIGRTLATPIPAYSTHCEPMWASPLIDWEQI
jgi:hypothetical protein